MRTRVLHAVLICLLLLLDVIPAAAAMAFPLSVLPPGKQGPLAKPVPLEQIGLDCQEPFFDPATAKLFKVKTGGIPAELYQEQGQAGPDIMVNGWMKEGEDKVTLPAPYDVNFYQFGCASTFSYVIEITKAGKRQALYTHVSAWSVSGDKQFLAMRGWVASRDGQWTDQVRIVKITTASGTNLPLMPCTANLQGWSQGRLVTTSDVVGSTSEATVCVWSPQGSLAAMLDAKSLNTSGNSAAPDNRFGLLPKERNSVYALGAFGATPGECRITAVSLDQPKKRALVSFTVPGKMTCMDPGEEIELDLSSFTFRSPQFRYRVRTTAQQEAAKNETAGPWMQGR